jgi:hypothetical protein
VRLKLTRQQLAKAKERQDKLDERARLDAKKKMEADLFRPAQVQKIAFGTDPKTVRIQTTFACLMAKLVRCFASTSKLATVIRVCPDQYRFDSRETADRTQVANVNSRTTQTSSGKLQKSTCTRTPENSTKQKVCFLSACGVMS